MWLKIWRDSSAMAGTPYYVEYKTSGDIESWVEYYDEKIYGDGCHEIKWERIDKPPIEWLKKEIFRKSEELKNFYSNYKRGRKALKYTIDHYKEILK